MDDLILIKNTSTIYFLKDKKINALLLRQILKDRGYKVKELDGISELLVDLVKEKEHAVVTPHLFQENILIYENIPASDKDFFEQFMITASWVISILNHFKIAFSIIYRKKYILANKIFREICQCSYQDLVVMEVGDTADFQSRKEIRENLRKCFRGQQGTFNFTAKCTTFNQKVYETEGISICHRIGQNIYVTGYGISQKFHSLSNKHNLTYLKFMSNELNNILANLIKVNSFEQNMKHKNKQFSDELEDYENFLNHYNLTKREYEILQYICRGLTSQEIAEKLYISKRTVETHRSNILEKTQTKNAIELIRFAYQNNLIID